MNKKDMGENFPSLETERLLLRKVNLRDLEDLYEYCSIEEVSKYVTWETHQSISDSKAFLDIILEQYDQDKALFWGIESKEDNKLIGTIDFVALKPIHKIGEIGYVLSPEYWGQGMMSEAAKAVISFGFEKLGLVRIQARCFIENTGSEGVMKKIGMSYEGTMRKGMYAKGKHRDVKLYSIVKEETTSEGN